jgi:hypothetical protein
MKYLAAMLVFFALFSTAEARQVKHASAPMCDNADVMRPCAYAPNFMKGVTSIKVTMKRVHVARPRIKDKPVPVAHAAPGIVRAASGATAHVASRAAGAFQCVVDRLQGQGYPVRFMGGFARSGHIRHSLHYAGLALDINQIGRNVTRPSMPSNEISIAHSCGLVSGAQWAHADSGHFQFGGWAGHLRHYASVRRHRRYASR